MSKSTESPWEVFGKFCYAVASILAVIAMGLATMVLGVWVLLNMWGWFVTPAFGLAVPPGWCLFGVLLMRNLLVYKLSTHGPDPAAEDRKRYVAARYLELTVAYLAIYGMGWLTKTYGAQL